jgi:chitinase
LGQIEALADIVQVDDRGKVVQVSISGWHGMVALQAGEWANLVRF